MAQVGWIDSDSFDEHSNGPGHVESPERLFALRETIASGSLSSLLIPKEAEPINTQSLNRVHTQSHIDNIRNVAMSGGGFFDGDTACTKASWQAALRAAGAVTEAVHNVLEGVWDRGFCSVRPPGHHAPTDQAMGFCLFNNIAIGAETALQHSDVQRVAILDWDVHHGNGTQDIFYDRADVMFASIHQHPLYPGSGLQTETGIGPGKGYTLNCPVAAGTDDTDYLKVWREQVRPAFENFEPNIILVSAGFDADGRDPLGGLNLTPSAFETITAELTACAQSWCNGRLVSSLEGGYNVRALAEDVGVHLDALLG